MPYIKKGFYKKREPYGKRGTYIKSGKYKGVRRIKKFNYIDIPDIDNILIV